MAQRFPAELRLVSNPRPVPVVPSAVLGTLVFVMTEVMLFAGMISAFVIVKAQALQWPPPGQPRLPVEETLVNTGALLLSGFVLFLANRAHRRDPATAQRPLGFAIALGSFFVVFQGYEWVLLIREGLTLTSSTHGSFFYLIVGMHALHVVVALLALGYVWLRFRQRRPSPSAFAAAQVFWYFVVAVWPILYLQVYL